MGEVRFWPDVFAAEHYVYVCFLSLLEPSKYCLGSLGYEFCGVDTLSSKFKGSLWSRADLRPGKFNFAERQY